MKIAVLSLFGCLAVALAWGIFLQTLFGSRPVSEVWVRHHPFELLFLNWLLPAAALLYVLILASAIHDSAVLHHLRKRSHVSGCRQSSREI